jgi:excisionase family DNA binding protein
MDLNTVVLIQASELRKMIRADVEDVIKTLKGINSEPDKILTLQDAAKYCGVCTRTLTERVREGKLTNGGTGRKYMFRKSHLDEFIFNTRKK